MPIFILESKTTLSSYRVTNWFNNPTRVFVERTNVSIYTTFCEQNYLSHTTFILSAVTKILHK